ncbi:hypothetical protein ACTXT7_001786 [Hymenolepis weldensis]
MVEELKRSEQNGVPNPLFIQNGLHLLLMLRSSNRVKGAADSQCASWTLPICKLPFGIKTVSDTAACQDNLIVVGRSQRKIQIRDPENFQAITEMPRLTATAVHFC